MKISIENVASNSPNKVRVVDASLNGWVLIDEHTSDGKTYRYALTPSAILELPERESNGLVGIPIPDPVANGGHRWLTPTVVEKLKEVVR